MEFNEIPWKIAWNSIEFFIEFHGKNKMKKIRQMFMKNFMEFHGKFHGIPWNSMEFSMKIFMKFSMEISMEFHGIPWTFHQLTERFSPGQVVNFEQLNTFNIKTARMHITVS
jgi:hypothetical protein